MKRILLRICVCLAGLLLTSCTATAQLSTLLREGIEVATKGASKTAAKGIAEGAEVVIPKVSSALSQSLAEATDGAVKIASRASRLAGRELAEATAKHGDTVCTPIATAFGDQGVSALASLSKESGDKLAKMASDLASHPKSNGWIGVIAEHGDRAVSWLWDRRLSIAVGTTATAVLLQPEQFIEASENVLTSAINATGQHLVEPMITETASHVAEPMIKELAVPFAASAMTFSVVGLVSALSLIASCVVWKRLFRKS